MDDIKKHLDYTLNSDKFIKLYKQIREKYQTFRPFNEPSEVIKFLREIKQEHYQANDNILRILIKEYQARDRNQLIFTYLFKILTPGLDSIFHRFRRRLQEYSCLDEFELWSQIRYFFLEVLNTLDIDTKPHKIAATIIGRVRDRINYWYWLQTKRPEINLDYIDDFAQDVAEEKFCEEDEIEELKTKLKVLVKEGIIKEEELYIIIATRFYNHSLKELAKKQGIKYGSMARRRKRAEEKIRNYLKNMAKEQGLDLKKISLDLILKDKKS